MEHDDLLVSDRMPVTTAARRRHAAPALATGGGGLAPEAFLEQLGLARPWPGFVRQTVALAEALDLSFRPTRHASMEGQWNGLMGVAPFEPHDAPDVWQPFVGHTMRERSRGLYCLVHETAHALVYEVLAGGPLHHAARDAEATRQMHILGEAYAGFVSHYELGLAAYDYWQEHFPSLSEQASHAGKAAVRAGMLTPEQRLDFAFQSYFGPAEDPWPLTVEELLAVPELTEMWLHERRYAEKTRNSSQAWWDEYWSAPRIAETVQRFTSPGPALVHRRDDPSPLEIANIDELVPHLPRLFESWVPGPPEVACLARARRLAFRRALALAQLGRYLAHEDAILDSDTRTVAVDIVARALDLLDAFALFESTTTGLGEPRSRRVLLEMEEVVAAASRSLRARLGEVVFHLHPLWRGADMSDAIRVAYEDGCSPDPLPVLARRAMAEARTGNPRGLAIRRLSAYLRHLAEDARDVAALVDDATAVQAALDLGVEARRLELALDLGTAPAVREAVESAWALLVRMRRRQRLRSCYRLQWLRDAPHIDPLVGFRIG